MRGVVTGAASGIGAACAAKLRQAGHRVIEWDIDADESVDVSSSSSVAAATARLDGPIDAVVLAAGVSRMASLLDTSDEDWHFQMNVNAFGVFNCLRALVPHVTSGGAFAIIDSMGGLRGAPFLSAYCASKFAVTGLIESATPELAGSRDPHQWRLPDVRTDADGDSGTYLGGRADWQHPRSRVRKLRVLYPSRPCRGTGGDRRSRALPYRIEQ